MRMIIKIEAEKIIEEYDLANIKLTEWNLTALMQLIQTRTMSLCYDLRDEDTLLDWREWVSEPNRTVSRRYVPVGAGFETVGKAHAFAAIFDELLFQVAKSLGNTVNSQSLMNLRDNLN